MLDAVPCTSSATCYAVTQPKALNQGYVLSKNGSGVWYRSDGYKLMKQSPYNNQYLNVSDNIALLAIGHDVQFASYYSNIQTLYNLTSPSNYWSEYRDADNGSGAIEMRLNGVVYSAPLDITFSKPTISIGFKRGIYRVFAGSYFYELIYYSLIQ